jgi:hypothetical protein
VMTNTSQTMNPARPTATQGPPLVRATVNTATMSRQAAPGQAATLSQAQREDFEDAKPGPVEQGEQGPVADPGRLAGRLILTGTATG